MSKFQIEDYAEDTYYLTRMKDILEGYPKLGPLQHPSKLLEHVYIGNQDNADNLDLLQALEITHVLNCAGTRTFDLTRSPYRKDTGIVGFLMMPAEDYEEFDIMQYFMDAIIFLDKVKTVGGRALVHCNIGVNRSGAISAAYLMVHQRRPLLKVIEDLKSKRSLILQNEGFRRQLVRFARCRGLLDLPERPPKKLNFIYNSYKSVTNSSSSRPKEATAAVSNQEKNESEKNENSNPETETPKDTSETTNNEDQQDSKETSGEQNSGGGGGGDGGEEEGKTPLPPNGNVGKFSGYEDELGSLEDKTEQPLKTVPRLEVPNMEGIREDLDKAFNRISCLDIGSSRRSTKTDRLALTSPASTPNITSTEHSPGSVGRSLDLPSNSKLSALSLELPRVQVSPSMSHRSHSDLLYPNDFNKAVSPVPSFTQRLSRESSVSDMSNSLYASLDDDEFDRKYLTLDKDRLSFPLDPDDVTRNHHPVTSRAGQVRSGPGAASVDRFVSSVKPRSYYQRLVSLNSSRSPFDDDVEDDFADVIRSGFEKSSVKSKSFYESGEGMLFAPYLGRSHQSPSTVRRTGGFSSYDTLSSRPLSFADSNYTTEAITHPRNTPYSRMSLSDLDSFRSAEFPLGPPGGYHASYRPQSSSYRSAVEYDNALDEYSDLLDASLQRSNAMGAAAKRLRSVNNTGSRKSYRY